MLLFFRVRGGTQCLKERLSCCEGGGARRIGREEFKKESAKVFFEPVLRIGPFARRRARGGTCLGDAVGVTSCCRGSGAAEKRLR